MSNWKVYVNNPTMDEPLNFKKERERGRREWQKASNDKETGWKQWRSKQSQCNFLIGAYFFKVQSKCPFFSLTVERNWIWSHNLQSHVPLKLNPNETHHLQRLRQNANLACPRLSWIHWNSRLFFSSRKQMKISR